MAELGTVERTVYKDGEEEVIHFKANVDPNSYDIARVRTLTKENAELRKQIAMLNEYDEHREAVKSGMCNEFEELLQEKDAEIAELKVVISELKEKIVRLA